MPRVPFLLFLVCLSALAWPLAAAPSQPQPIQSAPDFKHLSRTMTWTGLPRQTGAISVTGTPVPQAGDTTLGLSLVFSCPTTTLTLEGLSSDVSATGTAADNLVQGAFLRGTANGSGTTALVKGAWGVARNIGGGTATELRGVEANALAFNSPTTIATALQAEIFDNGTATVGTANLVRAQSLSEAGTITLLNGISVDGWAAPTGTVTEVRGVNIDTSIDVGTTHHAIYSASASASLFAGDVAFTVNNRGPVLKDSVTGHFVRLTLANGVLTQTDLGAGTP